jgi:aspartokinase/homoserine dehydrogenase 1
MISTKALRVMKFGGASVGDGDCIHRVAEIIADAARQGPILAVISAMQGVTDCLIQAARDSALGDTRIGSEVSATLRLLHLRALDRLISDAHSYTLLAAEIEYLIEETAKLCLQAAKRHTLTPCMLDAIASVGERLSARLVAGALRATGQPGVFVDATELISTNDVHGEAEPLIDRTRAQARARLLPLLNAGAIPIVTGFIGSTTRTVLTTLGRGGSDYSATILGAVLQAEEIILWKDVGGILTADPRLISEARSQPSISYEEANELASLGVKALHPKTLRPVMDAPIPVLIRNSFATEIAGTTITPKGEATQNRVKAVVALGEVCLIAVAVRRHHNQGLKGATTKPVNFISGLRTSFVPVLKLAAKYEVCFITNKSATHVAVKALRDAFALQTEHIVVHWNIAVVAVIGAGICDTPEIATRLYRLLESKGVRIIASGYSTSENNISMVVQAEDSRRTLAAVHREFKLAQLPTLSHSELTVRAEL